MSFFTMDWFKENLLGLQPEDPEPADFTPEKREQLEKEYLKTVTYDQVDYFHLKGYKTWAKPTRIYDADTMYLTFFINGRPFKFKGRLAGIDTAELSSKDLLEAAWAKKGKDKLINLIGDDLIWMECGKYDKYGRLLVKIFPGPGAFSYNEMLIELGYGYRYTGRKRRPFREWASPEALGEDPTPAPENLKPVDNIQDSAVLNEQDGPADYQENQNVEVKPALELTAKSLSTDEKPKEKPKEKSKSKPKKKTADKPTEDKPKEENPEN